MTARFYPGVFSRFERLLRRLFGRIDRRVNPAARLEEE